MVFEHNPPGICQALIANTAYQNHHVQTGSVGVIQEMYVLEETI